MTLVKMVRKTLFKPIAMEVDFLVIGEKEQVLLWLQQGQWGFIAKEEHDLVSERKISKRTSGWEGTCDLT